MKRIRSAAAILVGLLREVSLHFPVFSPAFSFVSSCATWGRVTPGVAVFRFFSLRSSSALDGQTITNGLHFLRLFSAGDNVPDIVFMFSCFLFFASIF